MKHLDGRTLLSASDLMRFTGCAHATTLDLARLHGRGPEPREDDDEAQPLQKLGDAHEAAHLKRLTGDGRSVAFDLDDGTAIAGQALEMRRLVVVAQFP